MRQTSERFDIDGVGYQVSQYSASKALRLLAKLAKVAGKPVAMMTAGGMDSDIKPDILAAAIEALTESASPEEMVSLCKEILDGVYIFRPDGQQTAIAFDIDFQGRMGHLFRVLKKVLTFQYADFLGDLAAAAPVAAAKAKPGKIKAV